MTEHKGGQPKPGQEPAAPRGASLGGQKESGGISFGTRPARRPESFPPDAKVGPEYYDKLDEIRGSKPFSEFRTEGRVPVPPVERHDASEYPRPPRIPQPSGEPLGPLTAEQRANPGVNPVVGQEYFDSTDKLNAEAGIIPGIVDRVGRGAEAVAGVWYGGKDRTVSERVWGGDGPSPLWDNPRNPSVEDQKAHARGLVTVETTGHTPGIKELAKAAGEMVGPEAWKEAGRVVRDEVLNKDALKETGSNVVDAVVDGAHAVWAGYDVEKTRLQLKEVQPSDDSLPHKLRLAEEVTETVHRPGIKDAGKGIADKAVDLGKGYKQAFKEKPGQTVRRTIGVGVGATAAIWGFTAFADFVNTSPEERAEAAAAARTPDTAIVAPVVPGAENAVPCRTQGISNTEAICDTRDGEIIVNIGEPPFGDTDDNGYGTVSAMGESYGNGIDFSGYGQSELNPGDTMRVPLEAEEGDHPGYDVFVQRHPDDAEKPYGVSILDQSGRPPAVG